MEQNIKNIDEKIKNFVEQIKDSSLKEVPKEKLESFKKEVENLSESKSEETLSTSPISLGSQLDVNIEDSSLIQHFDKKIILPSLGYFFNIPDTITIKLELVGEDLEAISKFAERFSPKDLIISKFSTNETMIRFSELQSFIVRKFTNINPENITFQDKLHINTVIGMNNLIVKMLDIKCPEGHTFQVPVSDISISDFHYLDIKNLKDIATKYNFEIINTPNRILFRYNIKDLPILDFEVIRSTFVPVILSPTSILDTLSFSLVKVNENPVDFYTGKEILKKIPMKYLQPIFVFIVGISLGSLDNFRYGYDITKEINFKCPEHNIDVSMTILEFLSNFFILF